MPENGFFIVLVLATIMMAIDLYSFKGIKLLLKRVTSRTVVTLWGYWTWSIGGVILIVVIFTNFQQVTGYIQESRSYFLPFTFLAVILINLIPKSIFIVFHLLEDVSWVGARAVRKIKKSKGDQREVISRSTFLTRLGLILAGIQFGWLLYGVTKGRFRFRVMKETLSFSNLPKSFDGLKIVQISDLHIGSFYNNYKEVERGVDLVNSLNPDIIFITGDLINNYAWELDGWEDILKKLKAKGGIYSILGNHDYGDYVSWDDMVEKQKNLKDLEKRQERMGFHLLKNESIRLKKAGDFIDLIGVENWGESSFHNYGDLSKAMAGTSNGSFKILLSHDPTHWESQVMNKTDIDLTFSGHTHGMQFGVEVPGIKWSPAKYIYTYWAGLYKVGKQFLYVNRGFGYTLFPGRVGINPEITLVNLKCEES